ncbi:sigma-54 dependent transcriptional regulator [Pelagicoccus sp. SDUM812003]|uniref:sigma-54-dependent transcriptional regulator n=1 Tax=Pelagicoccus sp. SDUM812003 TaxID=3041267 RepID=UPI00280EDD44|nr:sigma-54 dependent transcriptional regulator [Pelagicoccus sp. SDUM812003]MDQ8204563.1 sigma-54 dependent transcriptional regulator [Pelagicoccus sp. SDUM812003]
MVPSILIVDDERHTREGLMQILEDSYDIYLAEDAEQAFNLMESEKFDIVLTDLRMPGKSGMKVIDKALALSHRPPVIMMTAYGDVDSAVEAMKRGAYDFLTKPVNLEKLEILIKRALQSKNLETEVQQLHERLDTKFSFEGIVGNSPELIKVIDRVKLVAPSKASVLIEGETGTGKEMIAQAIHQNSGRAKGPFVAVHCAALPANLLESELFGHEKGSFTGATERRIGRFEMAEGGTLFLDEIGEIDLTIQVKLLRFLEQRTFERIGSSKSIKVDTRLVAATNKDLLAMTKEGTFREDLYYRLNVVQIRMPPLRERAEDLPQLLNHFLNEFAEENGMEPPQFEPGAIQCLRRYSWPGNIRELRNFAENAVVLHRGGVVHDYDLESKFRGESKSIDGSGKVVSPLDKEENEKRLLREALADAKGNRTRAAALLGISRRTLHRKLQQWPELDVLDR